MARPRIEISTDQRKSFLADIAKGYSDTTAARRSGIGRSTWARLAESDQSFGPLMREAAGKRACVLSEAVFDTMLRGIKAGHPYYVKLAIHTYKLGFIDPDVAIYRGKRLNAKAIDAAGEAAQKAAAVAPETRLREVRTA